MKIQFIVNADIEPEAAKRIAEDIFDRWTRLVTDVTAYTRINRKKVLVTRVTSLFSKKNGSRRRIT